jgi:hypothetical protein
MFHLKKSDLWWLLGWPVYQLLGTARHELSHAAVTVCQGARIEQIAIVPSFQPDGFLWGYVSWTGGQVTWLVAAAPYLVDLALYLAVLLVCLTAVRLRRWLWLNLFILGLLSPFVDTAANYSKLLRRPSGDVNELASQFSPVLIHSLFLAVMIFYLLGMWHALRVYHRGK